MADPWMLQLLAAVVAVIGFGWLAMAMDTHWEQAQGARPQSVGTVRVMRTLGAVALAASLMLCLQADHVSMAVLVWLMLLAAAVLTVAMTLSWRPTWLRFLWP